MEGTKQTQTNLSQNVEGLIKDSFISKTIYNFLFSMFFYSFFDKYFSGALDLTADLHPRQQTNWDFNDSSRCEHTKIHWRPFYCKENLSTFIILTQNLDGRVKTQDNSRVLKCSGMDFFPLLNL